MRRIGFWCISLILIATSLTAHADMRFVRRADVQKFINTMVRQYGLNRQYVTRMMNQVQLQPKIIESMDRPLEKKNWDTYKNLFLTEKRLRDGLKFWHDNQATLMRAEKKYGVPSHVIVAIIGVETQYGQNTGNYRVLDALSTLAFNYPKRSEFFTKELREYFLLCRELKTSPTSIRGSYAGAIGLPQFMPSSYRYYAVDFSGDGRRDLVNNRDDVIGSIANYFYKHGWKASHGIAQPAKINGKAFKKLDLNPRSAKYRTKVLAHYGVTPITASLNQPYQAGLLELITDKGNEYWLAYPNFFVITRYNSSPQYALAVYLLSQQLHSEWGHYAGSMQRAYA